MVLVQICNIKININELLFVIAGYEPTKVALQEKLSYEHQRIEKGGFLDRLNFDAIINNSILMISKC